MAHELETDTTHAQQRTSTNETYTVLIIDDDRPIRTILSKVLVKGSFDCHDCGSATEALDRLHDIAPDLIICDIGMPGMDGIDFCTHLRIDPVFGQIPLIFSTGHSDSETITQAFEAGANDYIIKPIRPAEVLTRARLHINEYKRAREAEQAINDLAHKNQTKSKFLGVASHDLRNPLVSIRGISQYLQSEKFGPLNDDQKELINTVIDASESMLTLVEELLDVSLLESSQPRSHFKIENLSEIVRNGVTLHSPSADKKNIQISADLNHDSNVNLDRKLISRLLDNLISNAIKFSPRGTEVLVSLRREKESVVLSVEDQGPGIPKDEFDKLFKEFSRTSNQPTAGESSSGIGLYVCKQIAEVHHAHIEVVNRPEGGARFTTTFQHQPAQK